MKTLQDYLKILTEDHPDTQNIANGKFTEKDIIDIFKKAGIKADAEWETNMWSQINMGDKRAPKLWRSLLNGKVYAKRDMSVVVSAKELDKLFKLIKDKWKTDVENITKIYQEYALRIKNDNMVFDWSYPDWYDRHGSTDDMALYSDNGVLIFLTMFSYYYNNNRILTSDDCIGAGNGHILMGVRKLAHEIELVFNVWVDISELASDNFKK